MPSKNHHPDKCGAAHYHSRRKTKLKEKRKKILKIKSARG
jgi:hypothetical protein